MDEIEKIKDEIAELRRWAHMPEKKVIIDILAEAHEFLLNCQPDTQLTPEGFYYRAASGKVEKVPPDFWWIKAEQRLVPMEEYQRRHGHGGGMRFGCYPTKVTVIEP